MDVAPIRVRFEATGRVFLRRGAPAGGTPPALLLVHGYAQPAAELLSFADEVLPGATLIAPEAPSAFYRRPRHRPPADGGIARGWIADPDRDADDARNDDYLARALDAAADHIALAPARTYVLGYSQGVGVATHFLASRPERAAGLVALAGGVPIAARPRLTALAGKPVLWVSGSRDTAYPPAYTAEVLEALRDHRVQLDARELDADHALLPVARDEVRAWLARRIAAAPA